MREASVGHRLFNDRPGRRIPFGRLVLAHGGSPFVASQSQFYLRRAEAPQLIGRCAVDSRDFSRLPLAEGGLPLIDHLGINVSDYERSRDFMHARSPR